MARRRYKRKRGYGRKRRFSRRKVSAIGTLFGLEKKINDQGVNITDNVYSWGPATTGRVDTPAVLPHNHVEFYDALAYSSGIPQYLGACAPGTGYHDRIGRKMTIHSILLDVQVGVADAPTPTVCEDYTYAFAIMLDKTPTGTPGTWAEIWQAPTQRDGTNTRYASTPYPMRNPENTRRFKVLWQTAISPRPDIQGTNQYARAAPICFKVNVPKVKGLVLEFTKADTTGTEANQRSNGIQFWCWAVPVAWLPSSNNQNCGSLQIYSRTRFYSN